MRPAIAFVLVAAWFASAASRPASAEPLRLSQALEMIETRGPDQAVTGAQVEVARTEVITARALPNPLLFVGAGRADPVFNASLAMRLPIFGQRGALISAAEKSVFEARAVAASARWRLRHDGRLAYYAAVRAREDVGIAEAAEALSARVATMAATRYAQGAGTRLDKEQGALVHVRALQDIADRRAAALVAELSLRRMLGDGAVDADEITLADVLDRVGSTPGLPSLIESARGHHPEIVALVAERAAALARAASARADRRPAPTLELGVEIASTCSSADPTTCVGPRGALSVDLPVLNLNAGPIARAEAEAQLATVKKNAAEARAVAEVRAAWQALAAATLRANFFDSEYLPAANSVEQMARESYAEGKTGLLPLLEAQRAVLEARTGRVDAFFSMQLARANLEEASGVLLPTP